MINLVFVEDQIESNRFKKILESAHRIITSIFVRIGL